MFDVPRGSLGSVVNAIATTGSQPISFQAELATGRLSGPITGRKSVSAALSEALAGSGLRVKEGPEGITVMAAGARAVGVNANAATDIADIDVVGTRTGDEGFVAGATASSTRIEGTLQDTPQSITGITKDVLTTQAITTLPDALTNVSGITAAPSAGTTPDYSIRGISNNGTVLINGQNVGGVSIPLTEIERIDVLKGPSGILSGNSAEGGSVNVITKQPTSTPIREASIYLGSFGYKTGAFDLGGPVPQTDGVTYRLVMEANTADRNYAGYKHPNEFTIFPQVRWEDAKTQVQVGINLIQQRIVQIADGFYRTPTQIYPLGRSQVIGNPDSHGVTRVIQPNLSVQRELGVVDMGYYGNLTFTVHSRNVYTFDAFDFTGLQTAAVIQAPPLFILGGTSQRSVSSAASTQNDLTVKWDTQYVKDTMRFGIDERIARVVTRATYQYSTSPSTSIPIANLQYANNYPFPKRPNFTPNFSAVDDTGVSFQNNVDIADRLHILGAVRNDLYSQSSQTYTVNSRTLIGTFKNATSVTNGLSYQAGATFDATRWMSIYGLDAKGFVPLYNVPFNGGLAPPYFSTTDEVGAKLQFLDRRIVVTGALYKLTQSNQVQNITTTTQILGPGFESRGAETDIQGQITPNLQGIGSFSFARYQYQTAARTNPDRVVGEPALIASAMLNYTFLDGPISGFSLGAGGHGVGPSYASNQVTATSVTRIPGYALADLYAGYHHDTLDVNFKLSNVANKYYYYNSFNTIIMPIGMGRTFTLIVKKQF